MHDTHTYMYQYLKVMNKETKTRMDTASTKRQRHDHRKTITNQQKENKTQKAPKHRTHANTKNEHE